LLRQFNLSSFAFQDLNAVGADSDVRSLPYTALCLQIIPTAGTKTPATKCDVLPWIGSLASAGISGHASLKFAPRDDTA